MILYCDASALVKRYVAEDGSREVRALMASAEIIGLSALGRVEVIAGLVRAVNRRSISKAKSERCVEAFRGECRDFVIVEITDAILSDAEKVAWQHRLRAYDAMHLATALQWQKLCEVPVVLATFDDPLWEVARDYGLFVFPQISPRRFLT
jgi:uncharacterized protein